MNVKSENPARGNIKLTVMKDIIEKPSHSIFFISDYVDLGASETIRKILYEATLKGILEKAGHGIYIKPKSSRFGNVPVPLEKIAQEIADRDKAEILPTGSSAANLIGLSTQVPVNLSYITTGSTRIIKIGERKIYFRHASPKNFAAKGTVIPLLIQGLREIGVENLSQTDYYAIKQFINKQQDSFLREDLQLAPVWIQRIIKKLIGNDTLATA